MKAFSLGIPLASDSKLVMQTIQKHTLFEPYWFYNFRNTAAFNLQVLRPSVRDRKYEAFTLQEAWKWK